MSPATPTVQVAYEGTRWGPPKRDFGFVLELNADHTYRLEAVGEAGGQWSQGTWQATTQGVTLVHGQANLPEYLPEWTRAAESQWRIEEDPSNLLFLYRLTNTAGDSLWSVSYPVAAGAPRLIDGRAVIAEGEKDSVTLDDARMRESPATTAATVTIKVLDGAEMVERDYVDRGHAVRLLARTDTMEAVQDWNDYWYYVSVFVDDGAYGLEYRGWMYGALLRK